MSGGSAAAATGIPRTTDAVGEPTTVHLNSPSRSGRAWPDLQLNDLLTVAAARPDGVSSFPLRAERLYEQAVLAIARSIQTGEFAPGMTLPGETELAQRYGVGRLVVREALRILAAKGLLTLSQGKAARVEPPERWKVLDPLVVLMREQGTALRDVLDLRRMLEPVIAAAAAERALPEQLAALEAAHEDLRRRDAGRTKSVINQIDLQFHMRLAEATGNRLLVNVLEPLHTLFLSARVAMNPYVPDTLERSRAAHQRILDAVRARDPGAARRAMEAHLSEIAEDVAQTESATRHADPA
jgi:GntR family transcriptional repressor for pyruvate dehydrogenase complex